MEHPTEIITPELKVEKLGDNFHYFHISFADTTRDRVTVWANYVEKLILSMPENGAYCMIFDIRPSNFFFTPYLSAKGTHLYKLIGGRTAFVAFVIKQTVFTPLLTMFVRNFETQKVKTMIFTDAETAIQWGKNNLSKIQQES
jgi:hypothetical protein